MCPQMVGHLLTWWGLGPTRPTRRYATAPDMLTMEVTEESNPDVRVSQREADARLVHLVQ